MQRETYSLAVVANATNATATATMAAPQAAMANHIVSISASFSAVPSAPVLLTLSDGATVIGRWYVSAPVTLSFPSPIRITPATAASLALAAGGSGVIGNVVLVGYAL